MLSAEQQSEIEAAEDFRRQLQERSLQGGTRPSLQDLRRWLDENPQLLAEISRVSWGSAPGRGLTPAQFQEELAAVPLPSPHDEPFTHSIVRMLSKQIEDACQELGIPLRSGVAYGSSLALAWIIHEVSSQKEKDALKGMMNTGFLDPAFPFGASIT